MWSVSDCVGCVCLVSAPSHSSLLQVKVLRGLDDGGVFRAGAGGGSKLSLLSSKVGSLFGSTSSMVSQKARRNRSVVDGS